MKSAPAARDSQFLRCMRRAVAAIALQPTFDDPLSALHSILKTQATGRGTVAPRRQAGAEPTSHREVIEIYQHRETTQMILTCRLQNAAARSVRGALKRIR